MKTIIRNAWIVNEGNKVIADILIANERIEKIGTSINVEGVGTIKEINAEGLYILPGVIDDQVHFREPGLTHKGNIYSESRAAVAGGITSFMEMPNTIPNTLTQELLEEKYVMASKTSVANYSFFMGINQNNLEEALKTNNETVCGITDDGLYFNNDEGILANYPQFLEKLFSRTDSLVALHSEDDVIIKNTTTQYLKKYGENIPFEFHPKIRSEEACLTATKRVLEIARKHNNRLHLFHISTLAEANLFDNNLAIREKRITAEACVHHLWFSDKDYERLGAKIKWNPAIKTEKDKNGLLAALLDNRLDIIATDHAPHTIEEKSGTYFKSLSGGPLVQHALPAMLELVHQGKISIEKIVEKMSHNVAEIYRIKERGYIREGYFADLVLVDLNNSWQVTPKNILYKCEWSPFENQCFKSKIVKTFVNGNLVYDNGIINDNKLGKRLKFSKFR
ncbi:dihydroorotase [Flavobacterium franklandianum]|uniref:Dihydroorotase n=1 Tax=Flavobacterium franklandianum TaxID=2594430 RepID=A0A553CNW5_9FLAO|nr:dihydroorotase [Flavobacterium franklandianum]TRX22236.1 dihydroorotase [Flavobacterium franklandianum]